MVTQSGRIGSADPATHERSQSLLSPPTVGVRCAFTPGPWKAIGDDDRHEADTVPVKAADGTAVCEAYGWPTGERPDMTVAEAEANARLIAAAPDLHRALHDLLELVRVHGLEPCNDMPMHEFDAIVDGVVQDAGRALGKVQS